MLNGLRSRVNCLGQQLIGNLRALVLVFSDCRGNPRGVSVCALQRLKSAQAIAQLTLLECCVGIFYSCRDGMFLLFGRIQPGAQFAHAGLLLNILRLAVEKQQSFLNVLSTYRLYTSHDCIDAPNRLDLAACCLTEQLLNRCIFGLQSRGLQERDCSFKVSGRNQRLCFSSGICGSLAKFNFSLLLLRVGQQGYKVRTFSALNCRRLQNLDCLVKLFLIDAGLRPLHVLKLQFLGVGLLELLANLFFQGNQSRFSWNLCKCLMNGGESLLGIG